MLPTLALVAFGSVMIWSATLTRSEGPVATAGVEYLRHLQFGAAGLAAAIFLLAFDYRLFSRYVWLVYGGAITLLVAVLVLAALNPGEVRLGAARWISIGPFEFQPSEPTKLVLIIVLAHFFATRQGGIRSLKTFVLSGLLAAPLLGLVVRQPDLGTTIVLLVAWLGVSMIAGIPLRWLGLLALAIAGAAFVLIAYDPVVCGSSPPLRSSIGQRLTAPVVTPEGQRLGIGSYPAGCAGLIPAYQRDRIDVWLYPEAADPRREAYNVIQATIAVGNGGVFGKGLGQGAQVQGNFLPVKHADFIFSVVGEELGLRGALGMLGLYLLLLLRCVHAAASSQDVFGRLVAGGVVVVLLFQTFVNIAVNVQLLPVTGIPLPFVSSGGTALMTFMAGVGLILSIRARSPA